MMNDLSTLEAPMAGDSSPLIYAEESILVDQARDGDAEAFEQLVQPQMSKAYRVALRITGNREDAEDAIQQAMLKAYAHIDQFHSKSRFSTWLLRITINEALGKAAQTARGECASFVWQRVRRWRGSRGNDSGEGRRAP